MGWRLVVIKQLVSSAIVVAVVVLVVADAAAFVLCLSVRFGFDCFGC